MFAHVLYAFNIIYLCFSEEVIVYCPFDALAINANRVYVFCSINSYVSF